MRRVWHNTSRRTLVGIGLVLGIAVFAISWRALEGETNVPAVQLSATAPAGDPLIVHEWGTFTSFSGSDGIQLDFRPNVDHELPAFVETRASRFGQLFTKHEIRAPLRMETPVTYFYTDRPRDVDVRVQFPQGLLTEFYPPPKQIGPLAGTEGPELMKDSFLDWGRVHLIPQNKFVQTRVIFADNKKEPATLRKVSGDDHYGFARDTDSAIVAAKNQFQELCFEKFLFYRGVGKFKLPLTLEAHGGGRFTVTNFGGDPIGACFSCISKTAGFAFNKLRRWPLIAHCTSQSRKPIRRSMPWPARWSGHLSRPGCMKKKPGQWSTPGARAGSAKKGRGCCIWFRSG